MGSNGYEIRFDGKEVIRLTKWKVRVGSSVGQSSHLLFNYRICNEDLEPIGEELKFKCNKIGIIINSLCKKEGDLILPNDLLIQYSNCLHNTIMKDLCADCGANINTLDATDRQRITELTTVSMVHSVPELRVSKERAETLGRADEMRLLKDRKLVLLVDLDQTIIHSTNHDVPKDMEDVYHFQLYGPMTPWYHTKFRPHTIDFLKTMSKLFELHICTFGARRYAHEIANLIDPKGLYFPKDRILSRDECFDPTSKTGNMKSLFPCGDSLVCIIDDREDVWNYAPNLVTVKPYICFRDTGDINAPEKPISDLFLNHTTGSSNKTAAPKENTEVDQMNAFENKTEPTISGETIKTESIEENIPKTGETNEEKTEKNDENTLKTDQVINEAIVKTDEISDDNIETTDKTNDQTDEKGEDKNVESKQTNDEMVEKVDEVIDKKTLTTGTSEDISKEGIQDKISTEASDTSSDVKIDAETNIEESSEQVESSEESDKRKVIYDDNDDYLLYLEEILTHIHSEYYKEYDEKIKYKSEGEEIKIPDLKEIIPRVRKCVLRGVNIVFSGVIPTNMPAEKHKLYNIAKSFGATVTPDIVVEGSPKTTHLVASKWGTVKVNKCIKSKNIWIVNPMWLYTCAERWERVDERLYPLDNDFSAEKDKLIPKQVPESSVKNRFVNRPQPKTPAVNACPVYDPKTGKRIRAQSQPTENSFLGVKPEVQPKNEERDASQMLEQSRQIQPHNMLEFSPLSGFTKNELQSMGKEVDDACSEGDAMSTGNTDSESDIDVEEVKDDIKADRKREYDSSSDESINDDCPKGWAKNKKQKRSLDYHLEEGNDSTVDSYDFEKMRGIDGEESTDEESIGSVDEEMALAVEREFLS